MTEPALQIPPIDKPALSVAEVVSLAKLVARRAEKLAGVDSDLDAGLCAQSADTAGSLTSTLEKSVLGPNQPTAVFCNSSAIGAKADFAEL
jgi:hypothetical protein